MTDTDAHAPVIGTDHRGDRTEAIMPRIAAARFCPHLAGDEVDLVMHHDDRDGGSFR